jgi:hypothetical protein
MTIKLNNNLPSILPEPDKNTQAAKSKISTQASNTASKVTAPALSDKPVTGPAAAGIEVELLKDSSSAAEQLESTKTAIAEQPDMAMMAHSNRLASIIDMFS